MRFPALACVLALAFSVSSALAESGWLDNFEQALKDAKSENKMVLMNFTGSDWCTWCIRLKKEVFSTPEFQEYAKKNLVLMEVDFPMKKKLPEYVQRQNAFLQDEFGVQGYPTLIVLGPTGKGLAKLQYSGGGVEAFLQTMDKIKATTM